MHRQLPVALAIVTALSFGSPSPAGADSALLLVDQQAALFAANVDIPSQRALVAVNRSGVRKVPLIPKAGLPDVWFSDHASLTVNAFGLELPSGGVNDAGLAVQTVWLADPSRATGTPGGVLETLQWVQYCLDSFATVDEVAQSVRAARILGKAPVQILACQPDGMCGMFESAAGRSAIRVAEELPVPALTGAVYREGLETLNRTLGYGGAPVDPVGEAAGFRFARAARAVHGSRTGAVEVSVTAALDVLDDLAVTDATRWQTVYDLRSRRLHVAVETGARPWTVSLSEIDTACPAPQLVADLSGDAAYELRTWDPEVDGSVGPQTFAAFAPTSAMDPEAWRGAAAYPSRIGCLEEPSPNGGS